MNSKVADNMLNMPMVVRLPMIWDTQNPQAFFREGGSCYGQDGNIGRWRVLSEEIKDLIDFILDPMYAEIRDDLFEHIDGLESHWKKKPTENQDS